MASTFAPFTALAVPACLHANLSPPRSDCRLVVGGATSATRVNPLSLSLRHSSAAPRPSHVPSASSSDVGAASTDSAASPSAAADDDDAAARVVVVRDPADFDRRMAEARARGQLAVVEVTMATLPNTARNEAALRDVARAFPSAVFLRVFADHSAALKTLAGGMGCARVPSYLLYRDGQRVHEDAGLNAELLRAELLYYSEGGDAQQHMVEVHSADEFNQLVQSHNDSDVLLVVEATLTFCGPCVRIHPTLLQLAQRMAGEAVFARFFGDASDCTAQLVRALGVVEAPTFLFYRRGELLGRYVGSSRGALVGEILKHQGVSVC